MSRVKIVDVLAKMMFSVQRSTEHGSLGMGSPGLFSLPEEWGSKTGEIFAFRECRSIGNSASRAGDLPPPLHSSGFPFPVFWFQLAFCGNHGPRFGWALSQTEAYQPPRHDLRSLRHSLDPMPELRHRMGRAEPLTPLQIGLRTSPVCAFN